MKKRIVGGLLLLTLVGITAFSIVPVAGSAATGNCGKHPLLNGRTCRELEQKILDSTVRIQMESWIVKPGDAGYDVEHTLGHGTVVNGRYLVTHNHFPFPLNLRARTEDPDSYVVIYLFNSSGNMLYQGPLADFELVGADEELLVLAHDDDRFFEKLGFASAEFQTTGSLPLEVGMTVAQIDWDGERTRVDWVKVQEVVLNKGTPRLVLADGAMPGASGGGIFWQGFHIANNWRIEERVQGGGTVLDTVTTVALNSAGVLTP